MDNTWSYLELKAAEYARRASMHYIKSAQNYNSCNLEEALQHALSAATDLEYSTRYAQQAYDYCFDTMSDDQPEMRVIRQNKKQ